MAESGSRSSIIVAIIGALATVGAAVAGAHFSPRVSALENRNSDVVAFAGRIMEYTQGKSVTLEKFNQILRSATTQAVDLVDSAEAQVEGIEKCYELMGLRNDLPEVKAVGAEVLEIVARFKQEVPKLATISDEMRTVHARGDRIYLDPGNLSAGETGGFDFQELNDLEQKIDELAVVSELFQQFGSKLDELNTFGEHCMSLVPRPGAQRSR